jgi:hypothetical protein
VVSVRLGGILIAFLYRKAAMESLENLRSLWPKAKPIVLPFDGMASQAHVLDVPRTQLERVIDQFCRRATEASITTLNGYALEEPRDCDVVTRAEVLGHSTQSLTNIRGKFWPDRTIQLFVCPDESGTRFDVEFVFWADEFFPADQDDEAHMASFGLVYSLAEMVREHHQHCECALTASEAGDPRDERAAPWTLFW